MLRRDAVEQVAVVGHEHERARELEQALLEHLERRDVEVVRRLVEQQQVRGLQHQAGEQHARACSPPESRPTGVSSCSERNRKRFAQPATWIEPPRKITESPCGLSVRVERDGGIEARAVLVEDHDLEGFGACSIVPASGSSWPASRRSSVRLAAAVRAQQAEPRAGRQHQVEPAARCVRSP